MCMHGYIQIMSSWYKQYTTSQGFGCLDIRVNKLIVVSVVKAYGDIELGQHWLR